MDCSNFVTVFRQQIKCECNVIQLSSVRVVCYSTCTAKCFVEYKHKTERPQTSVCAKIWRFLVFVIAVVLFLHSCLSLGAET